MFNKKMLLKLDIQFFADKVLNYEEILSPLGTLTELKPRLESEDMPTYLGDALFPDGNKQMSLKLSFIKGYGGLPVVLKPSRFDTKAPLRQRQNVEGFSEDMPLFREGFQLTEEQWREFYVIMQSNVEPSIKSALTRIFDDRLELIRGARAQNERMKMQLLSTGKITVHENNEFLDYDYQLPAENITTVDANNAWSNPDADILTQLETLQDTAVDAGKTITKAVCTPKTFRQLRKNKGLIKLFSDLKMRATDEGIKQFMLDEYGIDFILYEKTFKEANEHKVLTFFPHDVVSFFGDGELGRMQYAYTSEEMLLQTNPLAKVEVEVYGTGLALTRMVDEHTPRHHLLASQICLPSFEGADGVYILNTEPEEGDAP